MKSSTKIFIGAALIFVTLLSALVFYNSVSAEMLLEKVSVDDDEIRIQNALEQPIIDLELIENTEQCLIDCYAIIKIHPYQDITLPQSQNEEFRWDFVKAEEEMPGLRDYHFEVLSDVEYQVDVPIYGEESYECYNNETEKNETCWRKAITGYTQETRHKNEYQPFSFWGETLKANHDYYIKLVGGKHPVLGENNIDWVPTLFDISINEWGWWNESWYECRNITIDHTKTNVQLNNFPMMLKLYEDEESGRIDYNKTKDSGEDLRIVNAPCYEDGSEVPHEIEVWDEDGTSIVWFKLSNFSNTEDKVYSYYYYNTQANDSQDISNVWDSNFVSVYHLSESSGTIVDSKNSHNGTASISVGSQDAGGQAGGGDHIRLLTPSSGDDINLGDVDVTGSVMTAEVWVNITAFTPYSGQEFILAKGIYPKYNYRIIYYGSQNTFSWSLYETDSSIKSVNANNTHTDTNTWYYVVGLQDAYNMKIYVDGIWEGSQSTGTMYQNNEEFYVGRYDGGNYRVYNITVDEIRLSNCVRGNDWINATYFTMKDQIITYGNETSYSNNASEVDALYAIQNGIEESEIGTSAPKYQYKQIYVRYSNGSQLLGTFDVVALSGNKTWAFNYVNSSETQTGMYNLTNVLYISEFWNMTESAIRDHVNAFINDTN